MKAGDKEGARKLTESIEKSHSQVLVVEEIIDGLFKSYEPSSCFNMRFVPHFHSSFVCFFNRMFEFRWRDIFPSIRQVCIEFLGEWMAIYDSVFVSNQYLKYIGWAFNDKDAGVRLAAVNVITSLYEDEKSVVHLETFTKHFWKRISSLPRDVDARVGARAIELISKVSR